MITPYYQRHGVTVYAGDCLDVLAEMAESSVHAVVCDPPYGLEFMGKDWDSFKTGGKQPKIGDADGSPHRRNTGTPSWSASGNPRCLNCGGTKYDRTRPNGCACAAPRFPNESASHMRAFQGWCEQWATECLRVLKPGGHLVAFGGTRTYHRLTAGIEDAGFEIRDGLQWLYGSGFPKSLDVSKAIDKARDDRADILAVTGWLAERRDRVGWTNRRIDEAFGFNGMAGHWTAGPHLKIAQVPNWDQWVRLCGLLGFGHEMDAEVWRLNGRKGTPGNERVDRVVDLPGANMVFQPTQRVVNPGTPVLGTARQWQGWGTALKPAHEPVVLARKPLAGTVAGNVLTHGTGALNIAGTRTAHVSVADRHESEQKNRHAMFGTVAGQNNVYGDYSQTEVKNYDGAAGRWPSNVLVTHSARCDDPAEGCSPAWCPAAELDQQADEVARFLPTFRWEAKAPTDERPQVAGIAHPTVKPVALMRWLVRLVTPPGGVVLDPFAGSGTTLQAARAEGVRAIGIEREPTYLPLIKARLDARPRQADPAAAVPDDEPMDLLDLLGDAS